MPLKLSKLRVIAAVYATEISEKLSIKPPVAEFPMRRSLGPSSGTDLEGSGPLIRRHQIPPTVQQF